MIEQRKNHLYNSIYKNPLYKKTKKNEEDLWTFEKWTKINVQKIKTR